MNRLCKLQAYVNSKLNYFYIINRKHYISLYKIIFIIEYGK